MKISLALLLLAASAASAAAQTVRGELVDPRTRGGVGGAHVFLVDANGQTVAGALTAASGAFTLRAPGPGSYTVRAERIGYVTTRSPALSLAAGQTLAYRLEADPTALTLAGITAQAGSRCVVRPGRNLETAKVWEEA
ncbi:MAG TPA: carboxypeptidase-like regulatory domain-containing protein, partial [Longimicrobiaceae bacterium]